MPAPDLTARMIQIADAVVLDLNANVAAKDSANNPIVPSRFAAERTYWREWDNKDLAILHVDVRHAGVTQVEALDRGRSVSVDFDFEVAVQQMVDRSNRDLLDALSNLTARIAGRYAIGVCPCGLQASEFPEITGALEADTPIQIVGNAQQIIYDPSKMARMRFFSLTVVTFREFIQTSA